MPLEPYTISGTSCYPAINTENMQTIFEEHFVARTLEDAQAMAGPGARSHRHLLF